MSNNRISVRNLGDGAIVPSTAYQKLHRERFMKMTETGQNFNAELTQY